jgi:hypothetical protein
MGRPAFGLSLGQVQPKVKINESKETKKTQNGSDDDLTDLLILAGLK